VKATWTPPALADLDDLVRHIARDNTTAAFRTEDRILAAAARLERYPSSGRVGRWGDTRELAVRRTRYLVIYRVLADELQILRIVHGVQDWPPG
jgi:toxin ParE1/3/4